jgi:hypothetical protein
MPQRPRKHDRPRLEVRLGLPTFTLRKIATGAHAPAAGSRTGGTGTPRHSFRCPDELWGGCVNAAAGRGLEWGPVLRGYAAAFLAGEAPVFPDPLGPPADDDDVP